MQLWTTGDTLQASIMYKQLGMLLISSLCIHGSFTFGKMPNQLSRALQSTMGCLPDMSTSFSFWHKQTPLPHPAARAAWACRLRRRQRVRPRKLCLKLQAFTRQILW